MTTYWVPRTNPPLHRLLERFEAIVPQYLPEAASALLFGGITLGAFSPPWSDIDLIVWVAADEVTPDLQERAVQLWGDLAQEPPGRLVYMYVAPTSVLKGPMNPAGGGVPGQPHSLRVDQRKTKLMDGYPLSLPDTVSLVRHGTVLFGRDIRDQLPEVADDWPVSYLGINLDHLLKAVSGQVGPFGPDTDLAARSWGADGIMAQPLWYARQLYSLTTGELLAKEHAIRWYLGCRYDDALSEALTLILGWRRRGEAPGPEVQRVARLVRPATHDFLLRVAQWLGRSQADLPDELEPALRWVRAQLD